MSEIESLMSAAKKGDLETVKRLLSQKPSRIARLLGKEIAVWTKDKDQQQSLHYAASEGHLQLVSFLLDSGAPINGQNKWGATPLHNAASAGHTAVASVLLERRALVGGKDPVIGAKDHDGDTPLHLAASNGHMPMVKLLLQRGADCSAQNKNGESPLTSALDGGHIDIADVLLSASGKTGLPIGKESVILRWLVLWNPPSLRWAIQHGANPMVRDKRGDTPLHIACSTQFIASAALVKKNPAETLCVLLEAGADARAKNAAGQTPLDIVRTAPSGLALLASGVRDYSGSQAKGVEVLQRTLPVGQLMQSILEACATSPTPQEFAREAMVKATKKRVPFILISPIVRAVMDGVIKRYPGCSVPDVVQQSTQAFDFVCPQCGPLNKEMIELAVCAKWFQDMNPNVAPTFYGPNVAAVFSGWCPKCLSTSVEACFDPTKLRLGRG